MTGLTLGEIERELVDITYGCCHCWRGDATEEKLRALARRIAVEVEMQALASRDAA